MAEINKKASKVQAHSKPKQNKFVIGCTVGAGIPFSEIETLKRKGVTCFQIVPRFNGEGHHIPPKYIFEIGEGCSFIVHMPFYFNFFQPVTFKRRRYFKELGTYWGARQETTLVIGHCKGSKNANFFDNLFRNIATYASICGRRLKIIIENDAGSKANSALKMHSLVLMKNALQDRGVDIGICFDTQHAYAAGDKVSSIITSRSIDMVHLNSIASNIEFGGHVDRHSVTPLSKNKQGLAPIRELLKTIPEGIPVILERTKKEIVLADLKLLKGMLPYEFPIYKKALGKTVQKRSKVFY